jgi:hypothetical protein
VASSPAQHCQDLLRRFATLKETLPAHMQASGGGGGGRSSHGAPHACRGGRGARRLSRRTCGPVGGGRRGGGSGSMRVEGVRV